MNNDKFRIKLGETIIALRESKNMTQEELFFKSTISRSHIGMIERGKRDVTLSTLFKISRGLGVPLNELLSFDSLEEYPFKNPEF